MGALEDRAAMIEALGRTEEQQDERELTRIEALQKAGVSTFNEDRRAFDLKRRRVLRRLGSD